jgi:hypothetical protein
MLPTGVGYNEAYAYAKANANVQDKLIGQLNSLDKKTIFAESNPNWPISYNGNTVVCHWDSTEVWAARLFVLSCGLEIISFVVSVRSSLFPDIDAGDAQ